MILNAKYVVWKAVLATVKSFLGYGCIWSIDVMLEF